MSTGRILILGSEQWSDRPRMICGLSDASARIERGVKITLVRNSYASGAAKMVGDISNDWTKTWPGQYNDGELIPPGGDITANLDLAITFFVGSPSALLLHEVNLLKAARVEIMDYSIPDSGEEAA